MGQLFISGMINGVAQPVLTKVSDDLERQKRVFRKNAAFHRFRLVSRHARTGNRIRRTDYHHHHRQVVFQHTHHADSVYQRSLHSIAYLYQQLIISKGKSRIYMWNTIALGIILLSGVLLVHSHGIYAMLAVYVSTNILWLLTCTTSYGKKSD